MATYTYEVKVTDFEEQPFPGATLRVWVAPERDAHGPEGQLAARRIPVVIDSTGAGTVQLVASVDLSPTTGYVLRGDWLSFDQNGQEILAGWSEWSFTALAGGGPIKDMVSAPVSVWWVGPPWPTTPRPGFFWDLTTDSVGEWGM